jgi:hypothetical protein
MRSTCAGDVTAAVTSLTVQAAPSASIPLSSLHPVRSMETFYTAHSELGLSHAATAQTDLHWLLEHDAATSGSLLSVAGGGAGGGGLGSTHDLLHLRTQGSSLSLYATGQQQQQQPPPPQQQSALASPSLHSPQLLSSNKRVSLDALGQSRGLRLTEPGSTYSQQQQQHQLGAGAVGGAGGSGGLWGAAGGGAGAAAAGTVGSSSTANGVLGGSDVWDARVGVGGVAAAAQRVASSVAADDTDINALMALMCQ